MSRGMEQLPYQEWLKKLGPLVLERSRLSRVMIKVYKIVESVNKVTRELLFTKPQIIWTRGHWNKHEKCLKHTRGSTSLHCTRNLWKLLPQKVAEADSITRVKKGLDRFMQDRSINRYCIKQSGIIWHPQTHDRWCQGWYDEGRIMLDLGVILHLLSL